MAASPGTGVTGASILGGVDGGYELYEALNCAHHRIRSRLEVALQGRVGLSLREHEMLESLVRTGPRRMNDIADDLRMSASGLSRLADRLVAARLVERSVCPSDRRGFLLAITPLGQRRHRQSRERLERVLSEVLAGEEPGRLRGLAASLQALPPPETAPV